MTKILVTGATGFIGSNLVPKLLAQHHDVYTAQGRPADVADNLTWSAFPDMEVVIHLAGRTFVPDSWSDPGSFFHTNLQGTICALNYCRERKARLIFISSYLYGTPDKLPIPETATLHANNPYALSKKLAEDACRFYSDYYGVNITVLRPSNVYGSGQDAEFLIPSIIEQVLGATGVRVKDLEPKRDYLYIDDLTNAFLSAIENPQRFEILNIASGTSHSVGEVIEVIQNIAKTNLPVYSEKERRQHEVMDTRADITRAFEILGWYPRWSLRDGCARIFEDKKSFK